MILIWWQLFTKAELKAYLVSGFELRESKLDRNVERLLTDALTLV